MIPLVQCFVSHSGQWQVQNVTPHRPSLITLNEISYSYSNFSPNICNLLVGINSEVEGVYIPYNILSSNIMVSVLIIYVDVYCFF